MNHNSFLEMNQIYVDNFVYKVNPDISLKEVDDIPISIVPVPKLNSKNYHDGILELRVKLFEEDIYKNNYPFYLDLTVVARFVDCDEENSEDVFTTYLPNIISMMYPYLRSYIASTTGLFGIDSVQLPTINVLKLLEQLSSDSKNI